MNMYEQDESTGQKGERQQSRAQAAGAESAWQEEAQPLEEPDESPQRLRQRKHSETARLEMQQERQRPDHSRSCWTPLNNLTATKSHLKCFYIEARGSDIHFGEKKKSPRHP